MTAPSGNQTNTVIFELSLPTSSDSNDEHQVRDAGLVSDHTRYLFEIIVYIILNGLVSIIGIGNNIVNIIIFYGQGILIESSTTSLLGLAVADLCCLVTMLWHSVSFVIMLADPSGIPWDPLSVLYITAGWPHVMFTRVTCWITGFISLERCVCVTLPFKVKMLFTPRRSLTVVVSIFVIITLCYVPIYYTHQLQWVQIPGGANQSKLFLVFTNNKDQVEKICHYINDVILPTICLSIVMVCTRITVSKIHSSSKWRQSATTSSGADVTKPEMANASCSKRQGQGHTTQLHQEHPHQRGRREEEDTLNTQQLQHRDLDRTAPTNRTNPPEVSSDHSGASASAINSNTNSGKSGRNNTPSAINSNTNSGKSGRNNMPSSGSSSQKEKKVTRMITLICTIFLVCNTPCILIIYLRFMVPDIANMGRYHNLFHVIYSLDFLLETFNSSVNIVVYYTMSSRYKLEFNQLFGIGKTP